MDKGLLCQACQADTNFHPTGVTFSEITSSVTVCSNQLHCEGIQLMGKRNGCGKTGKEGGFCQNPPELLYFTLQKAAAVLNNITNAKWERHIAILVWFWWWMLLLSLMIQSNFLDNYQ